MDRRFSVLETVLSSISYIQEGSLSSYKEVCSMVRGLVEKQQENAIGDINVPKESVLRILEVSELLVGSLLTIKSVIAVDVEVPEEELISVCSEFARNAEVEYSKGDVVYFLPRCCPFSDVPPGSPFVVVDNVPVSGDTAITRKFAVEVAFIDSKGELSRALIDRRRLTKDRPKQQNVLMFHPESPVS